MTKTPRAPVHIFRPPERLRGPDLVPLSIGQVRVQAEKLEAFRRAVARRDTSLATGIREAIDLYLERHG